ncbi:MAG TPA: TonB family protein [Kofleriaceae bacterium]|nr:TonB family protein [Kofleriaceae bacterium]
MLGAAVPVAIGLHLLVLGTIDVLDISAIDGFGGHSVAAAATKPAPEVRSSCTGDAALAGGARFALCFAPWSSDVDGCLDDAQSDLLIDLSSCQARNDDGIAQVAMLEPRTMEKLAQIDPEPLLDSTQQPPKPPPPQVVPPPAPAPPPPPPAQARKQQMQVVETVKPAKEQAPENARFLAEYDTNVEKQTVARGTPKEPMIAKSKPAELTPKENPKEASVKDKPDLPPGVDRRAPDVPGTLAMRAPGAPAPAEVAQEQKTVGSSASPLGPLAFDGVMPRRGDGAIEQQHRDRTELPRGQGGAGGGAPPVPNLKPSQEMLERALGGGNVDHLEDVDNGDETALSAKRWIYASFFNRLKRQVAQNWDPASVWRRIDPTGNVNGFKTRVTEVRVSLSPRGELQKIVVTSPCGVSDLDDEAVRAFHAAAPFPNPPKELVASDNMITFAFSFFFEIGAPHTTWRVINSM